ncbi:sulfate transport system substrate-binding protein [Sanguibacter gelidistatuariae]|uniref:Sulfate transport system substrate-binding protein n=1 Tax=Sanguibacter gelidistatuariae TaxID=1814289 RepID=A0A1G6HHD5_9MICO|nr:sulfate ABC transporter substrate-binding protein [Sanguibacter gelidistatuariae]SDB93528.1 sulfate transport system substrate-binding protein [Sanguibacter gelidistatuariae]
MSRSRRSVTLAVAVIAALGLAACGPAASSGGDASTSGPATELSLVGFAVPKAANDAAQKLWGATPDGAGATWTTSYGASGDQSRAVVAGLKADYVHFSLEGDVTRLVDEGLVADDWNAGPNKGIVSDSVVVLVVRKGNPKNIQTWADIVAPGIGIVSPNPGSSGSARWNILAAYGSVLAAGGSDADAEAYLTKFFTNVAALPGSGRDATTAFTSGTGDVLISYENEAILARQNGEDFDYVIPESTLLIENPAAVTIKADPKAQSYLDFVLSTAGQTAFAEVGFRPLDDSVKVEVKGANDPKNPFPAPAKLQTIADDFGGWSATNKKFFGDDGLVTRIQQETGKS